MGKPVKWAQGSKKGGCDREIPAQPNVEPPGKPGHGWIQWTDNGNDHSAMLPRNPGFETALPVDVFGEGERCQAGLCFVSRRVAVKPLLPLLTLRLHRGLSTLVCGRFSLAGSLRGQTSESIFEGIEKPESLQLTRAHLYT